MKRLLSLLAVLVLVVACSKDPIAVERTNNPNVNVSLMIEHDGVRVWRFEDGTRVVYFTTPTGDVTEHHTESCGKNCSRRVETQTMRGR